MTRDNSWGRGDLNLRSAHTVCVASGSHDLSEPSVLAGDRVGSSALGRGGGGSLPKWNDTEAAELGADHPASTQQIQDTTLEQDLDPHPKLTVDTEPAKPKFSPT